MSDKQHDWQCTSCERHQRIPSFYANSQQASSIRCVNCGDAHFIKEMRVEGRLGPPVVAYSPKLRTAPWRDSTTRPANVGVYQCRFNNLQQPLVLMWDGTGFYSSGKRVKLDALISWRGSWGNA